MLETLSEGIQTLRTASFPLFLSAAALYCIGLVILGFRWREFVNASGEKVTATDTTLANAAGIFVNNVTPASRVAGEVMRISLMKSKTSMGWGRNMVASVCDRFSSFPVGISVFVFATPAFLPHLKALHIQPWMFVAALLASVTLFWIIRRQASLVDRIRSLSAQVLATNYPASLWLRTIGLSILFSATALLRIRLVAAAVGVHLSPAQTAFLSLASVLGGLVPIAGGIGVIEGSWMAVLLLLGVPSDRAIAITALERSISLGLATLLGGASLATLGGRKAWSLAKAH